MSAGAEAAAEDGPPLRTEMQKVFAALMVVVKRAFGKGRQEMTVTMQNLENNNPLTTQILLQLPDDGKLLSMKQLRAIATPGAREFANLLARQCEKAGCEPLEVFSRSALCMTHSRSWTSSGSAKFVSRQNRLLKLEISLLGSMREPGQNTEDTMQQELFRRVQVLGQRGIALKTVCFVHATLYEALRLLYQDSYPEVESCLTAGTHTSFTECLDHMLPGEQANKTA